MDAVCLAGAGLAGAGLVTRRARNSAALAVLWWFYDSVQRVMNHDPPLLFEAGFVAIFAAKPAVNPGQPSRLNRIVWPLSSLCRTCRRSALPQVHCTAQLTAVAWPALAAFPVRPRSSCGAARSTHR